MKQVEESQVEESQDEESQDEICNICRIRYTPEQIGNWVEHLRWYFKACGINDKDAHGMASVVVDWCPCGGVFIEEDMLERIESEEERKKEEEERFIEWVESPCEFCGGKVKIELPPEIHVFYGDPRVNTIATCVKCGFCEPNN